jgi:2-hydroxymethylglutarate dehydrogenase
MVGKRHLGFVGLGMMGGAMVKNLLRAGYDISVFDIDQTKMNSFENLGAHPVRSPKEVAEKSEVVFSSLPDPSSVKKAYVGEGGVMEGVSAGKILIDMSTVDPETSRSLSKVAAEKKVKYLDAPVSGGSKDAEAGKLTVIVGGERDAFDQCKDVLDVLGSTVHYAGSSGAGNVVKLINNVMSMGNILVAAEAFVLGVKAGVDGQTLFDIIRTCAGRSFHFEMGFPRVLARNFEARFTVDLAKKDLGLAVDMAKDAVFPIPATSLIHQLYSASSTLGDGQKDFTAVIKLFESWARLQVEGAKV